jgi:hypothetical protein
MARKVSARTVLNRSKLDEIHGGFVDAMAEIGARTLATAAPNVPDDPTTAATIVGDWGVWSDGKKVAGNGTKPRSVSVKEGITLLVGFPFPMRFHEEGTIHEPARPVLTPAMIEVLPETGPAIKTRMDRIS